jgi:hypothetical protein
LDFGRGQADLKDRTDCKFKARSKSFSDSVTANFRVVFPRKSGQPHPKFMFWINIAPPFGWHSAKQGLPQIGQPAQNLLNLRR